MAWSYKVEISVNILERITAQVNNPENVLEQVADKTAADVRMNIERKHIIKTGALLNSITSEPGGNNTYIVRDGVEYGIYQEFGTERGITARPFFVPAVEKAGDLMSTLFLKLLR